MHTDFWQRALALASMCRPAGPHRDSWLRGSRSPTIRPQPDGLEADDARK